MPRKHSMLETPVRRVNKLIASVNQENRGLYYCIIGMVDFFYKHHLHKRSVAVSVLAGHEDLVCQLEAVEGTP